MIQVFVSWKGLKKKKKGFQEVCKGGIGGGMLESEDWEERWRGNNLKGF